MRPPVAFVDANVLFSKTLCDWLFLLRRELDGGMFVLFSSRDSLTEVLYHLRRHNPKADGGVTQRRRELLETALDELVEEFSGELEFPGPDVHDHHIHAAAVACQARYLITNDSGFAGIHLDNLPYEVHTADSFLLLIAENSPSTIDAVIAEQLVHFKGRQDARPLDEALEQAGCIEFAKCVRQHLRRMAEARSSNGIAESLRTGQIGVNRQGRKSDRPI